jgi:hypothetical protein
MIGRKGRAVELNADYFRDGVRYLESAERAAASPMLFGMLDEVEVA